MCVGVYDLWCLWYWFAVWVCGVLVVCMVVLDCCVVVNSVVVVYVLSICCVAYCLVCLIKCGGV